MDKRIIFIIFALSSKIFAYFYNRLPNRKREIAYNWHMQDIQTPEII